MTSLATSTARPLPIRDIAIAGSAAAMTAIVGLALGRHIATAGLHGIAARDIWLTLHLMTVVPALPLGGYIFVARKGDRLHKALGKLWAALIMVGAVSSFGLTGMLGHVGPIHLLSVLVIVRLPAAILAARRGDIRSHRRGMTTMFASLVVAAGFTFLPGRMLGMWLLG